MAVTRENTTPIYENTTMQKVFINGVHKLYEITPIDGYVLHDKRLDIVTEDEFGNQHTELWFTPSAAGVPAAYDFVANPNEIYAIPRSQVDENCILGGGDNDHEVM